MRSVPPLMLALGALLLVGCKPERLPGEQTIEQQIESIAPTSTGESSTLSGDVPLGRIGRHTVTLGDFERRVAMLPAVARVMFDTDARRAELLDLMIRVEVMALEAQRIGLAEGREETWRVREMLLRRWIAETIAVEHDPTQIGEDEVRARFERDEYLYNRPELRSARLMLLATREEAGAALIELREAERDGASALLDAFDRIARERSLHEATREQGGVAGQTASIEAGASGNAALLDAIFATTPGELAEPVRVDGGWLVVLVERRTEAVERTVADFDWLIPQRIVDERTAAAARRALDDRRGRVAPEVDADLVATLRNARVDAPGDAAAYLPRRFDDVALAELPARYVGEEAIAALADPPAWRANPNYDFAAPPADEGSGAAAPGVPE